MCYYTIIIGISNDLEEKSESVTLFMIGSVHFFFFPKTSFRAKER